MRNPDPINPNVFVRRARKQMRKTQRELAYQLNVERKTIGRYETNGEVVPRRSILAIKQLLAQRTKDRVNAPQIATNDRKSTERN